jgi:hypothetical protein
MAAREPAKEFDRCSRALRMYELAMPYPINRPPGQRGKSAEALAGLSAAGTATVTDVGSAVE